MGRHPMVLRLNNACEPGGRGRDGSFASNRLHIGALGCCVWVVLMTLRPDDRGGSFPFVAMSRYLGTYVRSRYLCTYMS